MSKKEPEVEETDINDCKSCEEIVDDGEPQRERFVLKKWNVHALWSWDVMLDLCPICRNHLMDFCIECQTHPRGTVTHEDCTVAWGACNHAFHFHCISRWLKTHNVCPLDNKVWELRKYGR